MKKILLFSLVAGLILLFSGCNRQTDQLLERAENYLPAQPDSAEFCLNSIPQEELTDAQRALYGLLRTVISNHQGDGVTSDSLIRASYEYYRDASHAGQTSDLDLLRHYAQGCYYMSVFYTNADSIEQCGELLQQAIQGSEQCEDWHTCYLAHTLLSLTASYENPQDATRQALKALEIYHKINDDINNEVLIMGHVGASYLDMAEPDSALAYYLQAYDLAEKHQLKEAQNSMCMGLSDAYCYIGAFWHALHYAKIGVETADSTTLVPSLLSLAQCYYASDSLDKAKAVLDTIPCDSDDYLNRYLTLRTLSEIAVQNRDIDSLYAYVDSAYLCLEDRFSREQQVKDATVIQEYDVVLVGPEPENCTCGLALFQPFSSCLPQASSTTSISCASVGWCCLKNQWMPCSTSRNCNSNVSSPMLLCRNVWCNASNPSPSILPMPNSSDVPRRHGRRWRNSSTTPTRTSCGTCVSSTPTSRKRTFSCACLCA